MRSPRGSAVEDKPDKHHIRDIGWSPEIGAELPQGPCKLRMAAMFICARLSFNFLKSFTKQARSVHAFLNRKDIAVGSKSAHMTLMMTIHKIHQLSLPIAMWGAGIAVFAATLSLGVAFSDVEASGEALEPQPTMTQSRAIASTIEPACEGIIFREEDPDCFSGGAPAEAMPTLAAEPALPPQSAGS